MRGMDHFEVETLLAYMMILGKCSRDWALDGYMAGRCVLFVGTL